MPTEVSENNDKVALLLGKPKSRLTFKLYLGDGDDKFEMEMTVEALSMKDYDKLIAKYPPTDEERARGMTYELDKFAPALIAACLVEPDMTLTQAKQLWTSENWSRGDVEGIFTKVLEINHRESTVPFTNRG
jgi:hypothetical protein